MKGLVGWAGCLVLGALGFCGCGNAGESKVVADSVYRGNLIAEYDNVKVYAEFWLEEDGSEYGDDVTAKDDTYLIRYVDEVPSDTMVLKGPYNSLSGEGRLCKISVGTDTVRVDISEPFKKYLAIRYAGVLPGCRFYRLSRHFTLSERSFPTDFQINIAIQDDAPDYIRSFINESVRDDVAGYFADYSGDEVTYPHIPLFDIKGGDFDRLARYYYNRFCRLYKGENNDEGESDEIPMGPHYSYQFYAYPVWENADGSMITWKFYTFGYMGGAHGWEREYFLTFDNMTGRILGAADFYTGDEFNKAISLLTDQLNAFHNSGGGYSADLDSDNMVRAAESAILNEVVGGKL